VGKKKQDRMDKLVSLCKRRGFIFPSSQIYGGISGLWDFGPLGAELKRNVRDDWWLMNVRRRDDVVGMDTSIITHPEVWKASGHLDGFHDELVDCKECKQRFRTDKIDGDKCPECGGELTDPRKFHLMFRTQLGAVADETLEVYLRPETCQSLFLNFKEIQSVARVKVPFGIAQVGKSFRNEVTPRNFIFRSREFEQMEIEFFCHPDEENKWFDDWLAKRQQWFLDIGIKPERLRSMPHDNKELAHYAKKAVDLQYEFPFGWQEIEGIHNRGDFDLSQHTKFSGKDLSYFDDETGNKYTPSCIESSVGLDRTVLALLCDAYDEEPERVVLRFSPLIAPVKAGVFPLVKKDGLAELAQKIEHDLRKKFATVYDGGGSIGRRYRRQDEVGTPFGITVDYETLENETVTLRERDSMDQRRLKIADLADTIEKACVRQS
jgi:glycyl-tRNA synthetase